MYLISIGKLPIFLSSTDFIDYIRIFIISKCDFLFNDKFFYF